MKASSKKIDVLQLDINVGKAEAVRKGMNLGISRSYEVVGYFDADLATPLDEINRFYEKFSSCDKIEIVLGSRVKLLGRDIDRKPLRHYLGRIFATLASNILNLPVYDTQCGAKFFRVNEALKTVLSKSFQVKWTFDVELFSRFLKLKPISSLNIEEMPLKKWKDVDGSKVKPKDFFIAFYELYLIHSSKFEG